MAPITDVDRNDVPPAIRAVYDQAKSHAARGNWHLAAEAVALLSSGTTESIPVAMLISTILLRQGQYRDAHAALLEAARPPIDSLELLLQVVRGLKRFEEPELLEKLVKGSDWRKTRSLPHLAELAQHLGMSGLYTLADECLSQALEIAPDYADAHYLRGLFGMFTGHRKESLASIRCALQANPRMANAHWLLSMQESGQSAQSHVEEIRRVLPAAAPGSEARAYFDYSLHHSLHAMGRYEEAWQALERGHATMQRLAHYRPGEQHALIESLERMVLPSYGPSPLSGGGAGTGLIFIVGMFRSGTTLIERILAGHPDVADGGETYQLSACLRQATDHDMFDAIDGTVVSRAAMIDFDAVRQRMHAYANWRAQGRRWLTEKLPSNFLNVGFILHAFPEARIVHMRRDPAETCFSNLRTIFRGAAPYACDQRALADYFLLYRRLMAHWNTVAPGRILEIDYAAFVDEPLTHARCLLEYCDLEFLPSVLDLDRQGGASATASAAHVRNGILKDRHTQWLPYERHLQPMLEILSSLSANGANPQ
jgi:tetratricopeptide (TPR) repeat protein